MQTVFEMALLFARDAAVIDKNNVRRLENSDFERILKHSFPTTSWIYNTDFEVKSLEGDGFWNPVYKISILDSQKCGATALALKVCWCIRLRILEQVCWVSFSGLVPLLLTNSIAFVR